LAQQKILFQLVAEDVSLGGHIEQARKEIRDLNKEIRANPGPERMNALLAGLGKTKRELSELTKQQRALNKEFEALKVPKDSLAGLRIEYGRLSQAISKLSAEERRSQFGQNLIKQARNTKREIDAVEQSIGRFTGNVGNYRSALNSVGQAFAALGIGASVGEIVQANTRISDSIADVAKTAGITIQEAQRLADSLEFRDTRTSLVDQLQIAQIGGQLGVAADQLENFTESVDVLNVSLGDQFGSVEEITRVIAGLRNVLTDFRTENVSDDILRLGNALNFLEAEGNATAPTIAEFVNRISGSAIPLGVTTDEIFGLSTALAELSITPERGATAVNILLAEIAKAPDVFAKSLNLPVDDFNKLVRDDLLGALALVSEKVTQGAVDNVEFAQSLDELGIGRQGAIEVFGKLGGNIELLNTRVSQSKDALQATDSVYAEFDKKNNNAAAAVEKLKNAIVNLISSEGAQDAIEGVAKALTGLVEVLGDALEIISENKTEFAALGAAMFALSGTGQRLAAIMLELNAAARVSSLGIAAGTTATVADTVAKRVNTVATNILAAAQKALPLLALVAGIYAVVKAFEIYNANLSTAEKASRAVADAQEEIARSSADEVAALNSSIGVLQSATASNEARAAAIQSLTDKYPEYLKGIDLEKQSTAQLAVIQRELTAEIVRGAAAREKANAQSAVAADIVQKELEISRLRARQQEGGFSFQDLDFRIANEEQKLRKLREQLRLTGEEFDKVFNLDQPARSSVIDIAFPPGAAEKATEEIKTGLNLANDAQKKAGEKAAREREKQQADELRAIEAQEKRISEIRKSVRDLTLTDEDQFNQKLQELENRRADELEKNAQREVELRKSISARTGRAATGPVGQIAGATAVDITEADLIDQENAAIRAAFDRQRDVLTEERNKTAEEQKRALEALRLEVEQITAENIAALAESSASQFEAAFQQQREGLRREFGGRNVALLESLKNGEISQAEFDRAQLTNQIEQNNRLVALEVQYAGQISKVAEDVKQAKIAAAKASLDAQLRAIEDRRRAEVSELTKTGGTAAGQSVMEVNRLAAQEAEAAQRQYTEAVKSTTQEAADAQLNAVDRVNASKEAAHQAELQRIEDEEEARRRLIDAGIDAAGQIAGSIVQIQQNQNRAETDAALEALEEQYAAKIEAAQGNTKLQEKLERELAAKKEQIQKQSAEKEKRLSIIQSIINTAVAVTKALPNVILAAFVAAAGLAQTAVIAKQQFAEGGFDRKAKRKGVYPRHLWEALPSVFGGYTGGGLSYRDSTGRRVAGKLPSGAVVHAGEYVAPASQVAQYPDVFSALERERTQRARPFASGGFTNPALPAYVRATTFQTGGFSDPVLGLPSASQLQAQSITVQASASFTDQQVQQIGQIIAAENAKVTRVALAEGLGDANRRLEREASLEEQRTV